MTETDKQALRKRTMAEEEEENEYSAEPGRRRSLRKRNNVSFWCIGDTLSFFITTFSSQTCLHSPISPP